MATSTSRIATTTITRIDTTRPLLLTRPLLRSSLLEQIIQSRIDPSLINVAPERAIGSNDPISPVFPHYLDAVNGGPFPSISRRNERKVR